MLYAIWAQDVANSLDKRTKTRPAHVERLKILLEQGRLVLAGPMPAIDGQEPGAAGMSGSLVVAEFISLLAAQSWADEDPYVQAGVYEKVTVKPFVQALP